MSIVCSKCGAPLTEGDAFCASCGAPVPKTGQPRPIPLSWNQKWDKLLEPGEEPIIVIKKPTLRLPRYVKNEIFGQLRRWQPYKLDAVVATGQRLMFIRGNKIWDITRSPGEAARARGTRMLPGSFTIDSLIVKQIAEEEKEAKEKSKAAIQEAREKNPKKGFLRTVFSIPDRATLEAAIPLSQFHDQKKFFPPLIWVAEEKHSLRPPAAGFFAAFAALGCLMGPLVILWSPIWLLANLIYLPFRFRPWAGIQVRSTIWSWPESGMMEIAIFDQTQERQLFEFLQPRAVENSRIFHEAGLYSDHPWSDFVKGIRDAFKGAKKES